MAWRSHGSTNNGLVDCLADNGLIKTDRVKQAMKSVGGRLILAQSTLLIIISGRPSTLRSSSAIQR